MTPEEREALGALEAKMTAAPWHVDCVQEISQEFAPWGDVVALRPVDHVYGPTDHELILSPADAEGIVALRNAAPDLLATLARYEAALREIVALEPTPYAMPADWQRQIDECPECQGWAKNHPIQGGICDEHRRPLRARERHDDIESAAIGTRPQAIARRALNGGE